LKNDRETFEIRTIDGMLEDHDLSGAANVLPVLTGAVAKGGDGKHEEDAPGGVARL
jgi:hypothetical protein